MLAPKRTKFRKAHRGNRRGKAIAGSSVSFGEFGLQAQLFVGAEQGVVKQIAYTRSVSVCGVARVNLCRIRFDADDQKIGRDIAMG